MSSLILLINLDPKNIGYKDAPQAYEEMENGNELMFGGYRTTAQLDSYRGGLYLDIVQLDSDAMGALQKATVIIYTLRGSEKLAIKIPPVQVGFDAVNRCIRNRM